MLLKPHHLAAAQYAVLGVFLLGTWGVLLSPISSALAQLQDCFSGSNEKRTFFAAFAMVTIVCPPLAAAYWSIASAKAPIPQFLVATSFCLFALAVWQFDVSLIVGFGLGVGFASWAVFSRQSSVNLN